MNCAIGRGDKDNVRLENAAADAGVRVSCANGANCGARRGLRAGGDSADFPIEFAEAAAQSASEASSAHDSDGGRHGA